MTRAYGEREVFPHVEERINEDPARFLDRELFETSPALKRLKDGNYVPDVYQSDPLEFIAARIRGIDFFEVLAAWGEVERTLVRTPDGSHTEAGRDEIIELLEQRARELRTIGERDVRVERRREISVDDDQDDQEPETVWRHVTCGSTDVEVRKAGMSWHCQECDQLVPQTNVEAVEAQEVAA